MNKIAAFILEIIWLALVLVSLGAGIMETWKNGFHKSYLFFILAVISLFMYLYRRNKRLHGKTNPGT